MIGKPLGTYGVVLEAFKAMVESHFLPSSSHSSASLDTRCSGPSWTLTSSPCKANKVPELITTAVPFDFDAGPLVRVFPRWSAHYDQRFSWVGILMWTVGYESGFGSVLGG